MAFPFECKQLILLSALFHGGRLFVGAVGVLYVLSFGLQLADYAWIKIVQSIVFVGFDIPLGYFLSRIGEYRSLLLSLFFGMMGAFGYLVSKSLIGFLASEFFLALSLSIWPVAISAYSMRVLDNHKIEGLVEKFFHFNSSVSNLFILVCGSLGGLLFVYHRYLPYGCFLFLYSSAFMFTIACLKEYDFVAALEIRDLRFFLDNIKEVRVVLPFAFLIFLTQFFMQPLFHYWQLLFKEKFDVSSSELSIVFISYSLVMSGISWGYSQLTHFEVIRSSVFIFCVAVFGSLIYALFDRLHHFYASVAFFSILFAVFNLLQVSGMASIQNNLKKSNRIIVSKNVSFFARIGMIASLSILHFLLNFSYTVGEVYQIYGILATLFFCLCLGFAIVQRAGMSSEKSMLTNQ